MEVFPGIRWEAHTRKNTANPSSKNGADDEVVVVVKLNEAGRQAASIKAKDGARSGQCTSCDLKLEIQKGWVKSRGPSGTRG